MTPSRLRVIDSHTGGEPTRVVIEGAPDLGPGPLADKARRLREDHDWLRSAVCNEPRGHEAMVGAVLVEPHELDCCCGVIFFNNVSTLNMCIHGTIGLAVTLAHLGKIGPGQHRIDTPVGVVVAHLHDDGSVTVANVPSYRLASDVEVEVPGWGLVRGDIAWGGNWFFLIDGQGPPVDFTQLDALTAFTWAVRQALSAQGITGADGMEIDHIESFGPPSDPAHSDSRNFVLCPGKAYDRSPCGTGTSAKLATLHAAGKLQPGQIWRQAGILDSVFEGKIELLPDGKVRPLVTGRAWVNGESVYLIQPGDPFRHGIPNPL
ncbi:MAG: hydroxyproline-2-epimerase [Verrucomicrobia bacterium]|nr:MAG: hydroxyproline-2-epimerase [Verrucomicrobiota bacterium]TAE86590.1 MAG: hydroxyproline-2-epimerase [Verrucomicrobiota bacterium]TAF24283.1 MAG: hydroxyproline-2-epimerase [Verrucomicrobiota bacterium]TAF40337.1 MAG: hydroxyproline-2-epimerase [Verrucomicrobiota bacterium]